MVDDGSDDGSWEVIERLAAQYPAVRAVGFARNYGKVGGALLRFRRARGEVVFTMDADLQDSPDEIPAMRRMILDEATTWVSGWKKRRHDPIGKRWPSKFFNWTARTVSGIRLQRLRPRTEGLPPQGGQVKIEVYGEMHRYIPILARRAGFRRIGEKVVEHRARKYGRSKFGLERMIKGYPRPDYRVVRVPFRTLADVLLRQPRNGHVPARRRHHGVGHRRQAPTNRPMTCRCVP